MKEDRINEFQALLYEKFIGMNSKHVVKQVAPEVDRGVSTFYAYCRGEQDFPISILGDLIRATNDPQFIEVFLKETKFIVSRLPEARDVKGHTSAMLQNMTRFGELASEYDKSIEDGVIDARERRQLKKLSRQLISQIAEFMEAL